MISSMSYKFTKLSFRLIDVTAVMLVPVYIALDLTLRIGKVFYSLVKVTFERPEVK